MALTEVIIANQALYRLGSSNPLSGTTLSGATGPAKELRVATFAYTRCRTRLLTDYPWTFARKYVTLALADDGTGEIWGDTWANAYTYPADCLQVRRFVQDEGAAWYDFDRYSPYPEGMLASRPWAFEVKIHSSAKVILTDVAEADADIEYTYDVTDTALFTESFGSALSWLMAMEMAGPLSADPKRIEMAYDMARREAMMGAAKVRNEEHRRDPEATGGPFIESRGGM